MRVWFMVRTFQWLLEDTQVCRPWENWFGHPYSTKLCVGRLHPNFQSFTLFIYHFSQKRYPFPISSIKNVTFSNTKLRTLHLFLISLMKLTVFYGNVGEHKQLKDITIHWKCIWAKICFTKSPFKISKFNWMTDFPTLLYTSCCKIPSLLYTWSLKKVPFSSGVALYRS